MPNNKDNENVVAPPSLEEVLQRTEQLLKIVEDGQEENKRLRETVADLQEAYSESQKDFQELAKTVESVSDKGRLANWKNRTATKKPPMYKINMYNKKVVTSWEGMKTNLVYKDARGVTVEDFVSVLHFADEAPGTPGTEVKYLDWQKDRYMVPAEYAGENKVKNEETGEFESILTVEVLDSPEAQRMSLTPGTKFNINVKFLN